MAGRIWNFLPKNHHQTKKNITSKFQLDGVRRFGGVREHPNTQTHSSLTDWCFYRVIKIPQS